MNKGGKYMTIMEYIDFIKDKYQDKSPIGVCFMGEDKRYILDSGTNKVIECNEVECEVANKMFHKQYDEITELVEIYGEENVRDALEAIVQCMKEEHILQVTQFKPIVIDPYYKEKIQKGQQQLTLELTEQCNLRCKYCIYHESYAKDRNFGRKGMTEEMAIKAIDCFAEHIGDQEEVAVTFYGGEPLLAFNVMKRCMEYSKEIFPKQHKRLRFSFTTNLTLVTPEIAKYLAEQEEITIMGSLDGPQEIHDSYRVDISGQGSFNKAIRGLKYLVEAFGERAGECLSINTVYAPPYSKEKLQIIDDFFKELTWLPDNIQKSIGYVESGTLPKELAEKFVIDPEEDTLMERARQKVGEMDVSKDAIDNGLYRIYNMPIVEEPSEIITMNGCCLPGNRRLYVTVDGNFKMCERVGLAPFIGNINEGINIDTIKNEYLDNYAKLSNEDCTTCWAARLCSVCYSYCYKSGEFSIKDKRKECENVKWETWNNLACYYDTLGKNPEKLKHLEEMEVV